MNLIQKLVLGIYPYQKKVISMRKNHKMVTPLVEPPPTQYEVLCWQNFTTRMKQPKSLQEAPKLNVMEKLWLFYRLKAF